MMIMIVIMIMIMIMIMMLIMIMIMIMSSEFGPAPHLELGIRPGAALGARNSARRRTRSPEFGPAPHPKRCQQRLLGPCLLTRWGSG